MLTAAPPLHTDNGAIHEVDGAIHKDAAPYTRTTAPYNIMFLFFVHKNLTKTYFFQKCSKKDYIFQIYD